MKNQSFLILAEACNIDLDPLTRADIPALTADRLSWVKQNYLRQETIIEANAYFQVLKLTEGKSRYQLLQF